MALATQPNCLKCGQGRGRVNPPSLVPDRIQVDGIYQLATYPDCTIGYQGDFAASEVYVVGFRTEHERLFKRSDKAAMVTYFNSFNGKVALWHDFADKFCFTAMLELLGS